MTAKPFEGILANLSRLFEETSSETTRGLAARLLKQPAEVGQNALERLGRHRLLAGARECKWNLLLARAVKQHFLEALGQAAVRLGQVLPEVRRDRLQKTVVVHHHPRAALGPRQNHTILQRFFRVPHHQPLVKHRPLAKPRTGRAGAVG